MVSSVAFQLQSGRLVNGFGYHRRPLHHRGRGIVRKTVGSVAGVLGHALVNKLAGLISGNGRKRRVHRHRTIRGSSYRLSGSGYRRKPRARLSGLGYRKRKTTTHV